MGIVFGDIGTSPLYTVKAVLEGGRENFSSLLVYGALSCVFWTLTLQTTIKYITITLRADNKGEGGIFALFALMRKKSTWAAVLTMIGGGALLAVTGGLAAPAIAAGLGAAVTLAHGGAAAAAAVAGFAGSTAGTAAVTGLFGAWGASVGGGASLRSSGSYVCCTPP